MLYLTQTPLYTPTVASTMYLAFQPGYQGIAAICAVKVRLWKLKR